MGFYTKGQLDLNKYDNTTQSDYSANVDPNKILNDPAFLNDLRSYYRDKGEYFADDKHLIDKFYSDKTWDDLNTMGAIGSAVEAHTGNKEQRERMKRIESVWRQLPFFWQEGGRGSKAFGDIATSILADPVNLIPGVAAYKGAATAGRTAYLAGKSSPMARGILGGTTKAAGAEAAIGAGTEAVVNTAHQARDIELGLQDDFSYGQLGAATGAGAVLGGTIGGAIGLPTAIAGARQGIDTAKAGQFMGLSPEQINALSPEQLAQLQGIAGTGRTGPFPDPNAQRTETEAPTTEAEPEQKVSRFTTGEFGDFAGELEEIDDLLNTSLREARRLETKVRSSEADAETLQDARSLVTQIASMRGAVARAELEAKQIIELEKSNDIADLKTAQARRSAYEEILSDVRLVLSGAEGLTPEQIFAKMEADGFGLKTPKKSDTAEATTAEEAVEPVNKEEVPVNDKNQQVAPKADEEPVTTEKTDEPEVEEPKDETDELIDASRAVREDDTVLNKMRTDDPDAYKDTIIQAIRANVPSSPDGHWKQPQINTIEEAIARAETPEQIDKIADIASGIASSEKLITNRRLKKLLGLDKKPVTTEAPISADMKGRALAKGFDWRKLKPNEKSAEGRVTRGSLADAIKEKGGEGDDAYALQIQDETFELIELLNGVEELRTMNADQILEAITELSKTEKYGAGARTEDIVALARHELKEAGYFDDVLKSEDKIWTTTEQKLIREHMKSLKGEYPELGEDAIRYMAETRTNKQRGAQPRSDVRSTQPNIERKSILTTAGRAETGRIQGILRRGTPIAKGSDYTTTSGYKARANELGREAAALRALQTKQEPLTGGKLKKAQAQYKQMIANGIDEAAAKRMSGLARGTETYSDLVPYTTTGREMVFGHNGLEEVKKGGTAWYDGVTRKAYISRELAMRARGDSPAPVKKPDGEEVQEKIQTLLARIKAKDGGGPEALLAELQAKMKKKVGDTPEAKIDAPDSSNAKASPSPQKGNKKLIVRSKDDPTDIRIMSEKQVQDGKDIYAIIGQKGGRASDPANWDVRYAPMDANPKSITAKTDLFESLPPEEGLMEGQPSVGGLYEAGNATGLGQPLSVDEIDDTIVKLSDEEAEILKNVTNLALKQDGGSFQQLNAPREVTFKNLRYATGFLDGSSRWPLDVLQQQQIVKNLKVLYAAQQRAVPQGYILPNAERKIVVDEIHKVFDKFNADEIAQAKRLVESLGGDPNIAPIFRGKVAKQSRDSAGTYNRASNAVAMNQTIAARLDPRTTTLLHEVGHWAYQNILTPQDRITFWEGIDKYYDAGGKIDKTRVRNHLPKFSEEKVTIMEGGEERATTIMSNAETSPQEFFANQFAMWASQNRKGLAFTDENYWRTVTRFVKAVFDRFFDKKRIDPDLEPLFAKILPEEERKVFAGGVDGQPTKKEGEVIHSRFKMLELIEEDIVDAIERDSTDGIINAFQDLQRWILGIAVNNKEIQISRHIKMGGSGPLIALRRTDNKPQKLLTMLNDKFRAMDEIMRGNAMGDFVSIDDRPMARKFLEGGEFEGLTRMKANPEVVAEDLKDFYYNGYLGKWQPEDGIPPKIKKLELSSTKQILVYAREALSAGYNRVEGHQLLPPDSVPQSVKGNEPPIAEDGTVKLSPKKKEAATRQKREETSTLKQAVRNAKTSKNKRSKAPQQDAPDIDPTTAKELKSTSLRKLMRMYKKHAGTDYGDQISNEIISKIKSRPVSIKEVEITREIHQMSGKQLEDNLLNALHEGDRNMVSMTAYEIARRKKSTKEIKIPAKFHASLDIFVQREMTDSQGVAKDDGIPASARASVRDMLGKITHRDAEVQTSARTIAYRMLNIINKTPTGERISTADMARLGGGDTRMVGDGVFGDYRSADFNNFRKEIRRIAAIINRGKGKSDQAMFNLMKMITRSGILDANESDAIRQAFKARYKQDAPQEVADEWFAEEVSKYTREDLRRAAIIPEDTDISLRQTFDDAIDKVIEHSAYVLNGQIGSTPIRNRYRRLTFYGDMFTQRSNAPHINAYGGQIIHHPNYVVDVAYDTWKGSSRSRKANIVNYTKGGVGFDEAGQRPIVFFHGTPAGFAFRRTIDNPNVVFRKSTIGNNGPGFYLTENPNVAQQVYANRPTLASMTEQIRDLDVDDVTKEEMYAEAHDVTQLRMQITKLRRQYNDMEEAMFVEGESFDIDHYQNELDKLIHAEQYITDGLAQQGIVFDSYVMPMFVDLKTPVDFRYSADYNIDHPMIKSIMGEILVRVNDSDRALTYLQDTMVGDLSGPSTYAALVKSIEATGSNVRGSQATLTKILEDLGYDGMLTTHSNTLSYSTDRMADGQTYGASHFSHTALVLFKPEQAKHVEADYFDRNDAQLYNSKDEFVSIDKGTSGDLINSFINNDINSFSDIPVGQFGELVEEGGANSTISSAVMSMLRKREPSVAEEQAIRKHGVFGFLNRVSTKIRNQGMNWLADRYAEHYPDMQQRFGSKIMPIFNKLRSLPDSDGILRSYFRRSTAGFGQEQPKSHARITRALRRGDGSRAERLLTTDERSIYKQVRSVLANERNEMIAEGFHVGDRGPNYLPQVWDQSAIRKNKDEFIAKMKRYYEVESLSNNRTYSDAEAQAFAEGIMLKLLDESEGGVFIPVKGSTKNSTFENVDYSRVIELEKYPDMLNELEGFLESNLENLLVKYLEGSSRRLTSAKRFGVNSHAVSDYMMVAKEGRMGIARLLSKARQFEYDVTAMNSEGIKETATLVDTIRMPFENNKGEAVAFADKLLEVGTTSGPAGVKQMLMDIAPMVDGKVSPVYKKRVDAIVGAIQDFKGKTGQIAYDTGEEYVDNAMRIPHKKPMHGTNKTGMRVSRGLRFFNNVSLLGFTTLTSIGDLGLPIIRSGSFKSWAKGLYNMQDKEYRQMIKNIGVAMENIVHERMVHMYGAPDNKASHAFFNATLLTPWTDMNRQIAGATGYETFKTMQIKAQQSFKAGTPYAMQSGQYKTAHRFLKNYGLEEYLPGATKANESLGNRQLLDVDKGDDKVRMAVIKFADDAIFQPNPNDIPMWAQTPVGSLVFQLKSFPLMMTRLGGHVLSEANKGNLTPLIYLASIGPAFGAVTLSVKDIIQMRGGEDDRSPEFRKRNLLKALGYDKDTHGDEQDFLGWYVESMMVMGGLGLMGDVIHSAVTQADNGAYGQQRMWSTLLGPSFGLGTATMNVTAGLMDEKDNSNAKERSAVREMATRIPVLGGNRKFREGVVDASAGEASSGNTGGWKSSMTDSY